MTAVPFPFFFFPTSVIESIVKRRGRCLRLFFFPPPSHLSDGRFLIEDPFGTAGPDFVFFLAIASSVSGRDPAFPFSSSLPL